MALTEPQRLRNQLGAHTQWSRESDRPGRTAKARKAFLDRFEREVDPDGVLPTQVRAQMAESARKAYFTRLALQSVRARKARTGRAGRKRGGADAR